MSVDSTGWGGVRSTAGMRTSGVLLFSGALRGDPRGTMISHASAGGGSASVAESQAAQHYPTSKRTFRRLRVTVLENSFSMPYAVALCRGNTGGGTDHTQLVIVVPAGAAPFSKYVADVPNPIEFLDGEDFDIQQIVQASDGVAKISVSLE